MIHDTLRWELLCFFWDDFTRGFRWRDRSWSEAEIGGEMEPAPEVSFDRVGLSRNPKVHTFGASRCKEFGSDRIACTSGGDVGYDD